MIQKVKIKADTVYIILLILVGFFVFNKELFNKGTIGIRSDWPIPPLQEQIEVQVENDTMYAWNSSGFGYERNRQAGNYIDFVNLFISSTFNVGGEVISKYPIIFFILSSITCYVVLRKMHISEFFAFWGGYFYVYNVPFLTNSLLNGYLKFIVSYALFPIFIYLLIKILDTKKIPAKTVVSLSLVFALVSGVLNFFFIGILVAGIVFLLEIVRTRFDLKYIFHRLIALFIMVLSAVLVQATAFFIPIFDLFNHRSQTVINSLDSGLITFLTFSHPLSFAAFRLFSTVDNLFERTFYQFGFSLKLIAIYLMFLFFVVFVNFLIEKKNRTTQIILVLCITSLFVLKGINEPFGSINKLFYSIPLMAVLRNISYITLITGFTYAYLLANGGQYIYRVIKNLGFEKLSNVVFLSMFITILGSYPLVSHKVLGGFDQYTVPESISNMYQKIGSYDGSFNIINFPPLSPFLYLDESAKKYIGPGFNPFINNSAKPSLFSNVTIGYSHDKHAYLYNSLLHSEFGLNNTMLNLLNIGLITYDRHFESIYPAFIIYSDNNWFKSYLMSRNIVNGLNNSNLELVEEFGGSETLLFKTKNFVDNKIIFAKDLALDVGDNDNLVVRSRMYNTDSKGISDLIHFIEADNYKDYLSKYIKFIHFGDSDIYDLAFNLIDRKYSYEPGNFMEKNRNDARKEWTPIYHGQFWWYDMIFNQKDNVMLYIGYEGERSFKFDTNVVDGTEYEVYARVFMSVNGTEIIFDNNDNYIGNVFTKSNNYRGFKYVRIGSFTANGQTNTIKFHSKNGVNAVADVIVAPKDIIESSLVDANSLVKEKPVILSYDAHTLEGVGASGPDNNLYYSRKNDPLNKTQIKVTIPKDGTYELQALVSKEKLDVSESVNAEYFKIVNHNHALKQDIIVKTKIKDAELCMSYSYIDRKTFKPSLKLPNAPLLVTLTNVSKGNTKVLEAAIVPTKLYGYGDMLFECIKFDGSSMDINNKLELAISSFANKDNVVWAIPYAKDLGLSEGETMRHQLRGYNLSNVDSLSLNSNGRRFNQNIQFEGKTAKVVLGNQDFKAGEYILEAACGSVCRIDNLVLSQVSDISTSNIVASYEMKNPSEYTFTIPENVSDKNILIFKESYNDFWDYDSENHFIANGIFNAWLVEDPAQFSNKIFFRKQYIYDIAGFVANIVLISLLGIYVYFMMKDKNENNE